MAGLVNDTTSTADNEPDFNFDFPVKKPTGPTFMQPREGSEFEFGAPGGPAPAAVPQKAVAGENFVKAPAGWSHYGPEEFIANIPDQKQREETRGQYMEQELPAGAKAFESFGGGFLGPLTMGWAPRAEAAVAKGASYLLPTERAAQIRATPMEDLVSQQRGIEAAAGQDYPKTRLAGTGAGIVGSVAALPVVAPEAGALASGAATGATYGAVEGFGRNLDPWEAGSGALRGAETGAILGPAFEKGAKVLGFGSQNVPQVIDKNGGFVPAAIEAAQAAGLTDEQIMNYAPQLKDSFEKYGINPAAARQGFANAFGINLTKGAATQDPDQIALELAKSSKTGPAFAAPSHERIAGEAENAATNISGAGPNAPDVKAATEKAALAAKAEAEGAEAAYQNAYKTAGQQQGVFTKDAITNIGTKTLQNWATDDSMLAFHNNEYVQKVAADLDNALGKPIATSSEAEAARLRAQGLPVTAGGESARIPNTFRAAEEGRKGLNTALQNAPDNTAREGVRKLISSFDDHIENAVNEGAFSGDPRVVQDWRNARAAYRDYQTRFGIQGTGAGDAGSLMKSIIEGKKTPDDIAGMLYNFDRTGDAAMKANAANVLRQFQRALGPDHPALQQIKSSYMKNLLTPSEAGPAGFNKVAQNIDDLLVGRRGAVGNEVFNFNEIKTMKDFADVMRLAGTTSSAQMPNVMTRLRAVISHAPQYMADNLITAASFHSPALGAMIGMGKTAYQLGKEVAGFPSVRAFHANEALPQLPTRAPGARVLAPALNSADFGTQAQEQREGRATGGKVGFDHIKKANELISLADKIKKDEGKRTSSILNVDDNTVAHALAVVNKKI